MKNLISCSQADYPLASLRSFESMHTMMGRRGVSVCRKFDFLQNPVRRTSITHTLYANVQWARQVILTHPHFAVRPTEYPPLRVLR